MRQRFHRPICHVALHAAALVALLMLSLAMLVVSAEEAQTDDASDVISGRALTPGVREASTSA